MKNRIPQRILVSLALILGLALFTSGTAFAQENGAHMDVDHDATYGEMVQNDSNDTTIIQQETESRDADERVVEEDRDRDRVVERETRTDRPNWSWILARNALAGGITGGLIGLGLWLVTDMDMNAWTIAQFAGGGILVGTAIGVVELMVRADEFAMEQPSSVSWVERDLPQTFDVPVFRLNF